MGALIFQVRQNPYVFQKGRREVKRHSPPSVTRNIESYPNRKSGMEFDHPSGTVYILFIWILTLC